MNYLMLNLLAKISVAIVSIVSAIFAISLTAVCVDEVYNKKCKKDKMVKLPSSHCNENTFLFFNKEEGLFFHESISDSKLNETNLSDDLSLRIV